MNPTNTVNIMNPMNTMNIMNPMNTIKNSSNCFLLYTIYN